MEAFKDTFLSEKCMYVYPWLTAPAFDDPNKYYGKFDEPGSHDSERLSNWVNCKKRRAFEMLPIAFLVAIIIMLISPKILLDWHIDYLAEGVIIVAAFAYITAEYRARYAYRMYLNDRIISGFSQKEMVNYKKKNFGPSIFELL